jgi:hypothetical protein
VLVNTGDFEGVSGAAIEHGRVVDALGRHFPVLSYSTPGGRHDTTIPDFVFDHWQQTGLQDYEATRNVLKRFDNPPPATDCLGWRGANTNPTRERLVRLDDKQRFDCEFIVWNRDDPAKLSATNFLSLEQQVANWRYLIDMEGRGYSGRLKLLLCAPRVVFVQHRVHEEFFFPWLRAWVHYVPLRNDLADLEDALARVQYEPELERSIIRNARGFSQLFLPALPDARLHEVRDSRTIRRAGALTCEQVQAREVCRAGATAAV